MNFNDYRYSYSGADPDSKELMKCDESEVEFGNNTNQVLQTTRVVFIPNINERMLLQLSTWVNSNSRS